MSREPLQTLVGTAAPFLRPNVDTDVIIRVDRMVSMDPADLAPYAFEALRFDAAGDEDTECIFNQKPFRGAPILLAGPNFGCGSSREPAVWALQGMGVRCVVAPSFGDIFEANCHQNGLLPITLPEDQMHELAAVADTGALGDCRPGRPDDRRGRTAVVVHYWLDAEAGAAGGTRRHRPCPPGSR